MSDDGLYKCQVGGRGEVDPIVSDTVRLTVLVETSVPQILQGEQVEVVEGAGEVLQCMAEGRPRPEVRGNQKLEFGKEQFVLLVKMANNNFYISMFHINFCFAG